MEASQNMICEGPQTCGNDRHQPCCKGTLTDSQKSAFSRQRDFSVCVWLSLLRRPVTPGHLTLRPELYVDLAQCASFSGLLIP